MSLWDQFGTCCETWSGFTKISFLILQHHAKPWQETHLMMTFWTSHLPWYVKLKLTFRQIRSLEKRALEDSFQKWPPSPKLLSIMRSCDANHGAAWWSTPGTHQVHLNPLWKVTYCVGTLCKVSHRWMVMPNQLVMIISSQWILTMANSNMDKHG